MTERAKFRHYIEALPVWLLPKLLRPLPFRARVRVGGALISGMLRIVPSLRRRITNNLALIYPAMPLRERRRLLHAITRNIGWGFFELIYNHQYTHRTHEMQLSGDIAPVEKAHAENQPVLFISAHFGQWEAARALLGPRFKPLAGLYHPATNPIFAKIYDPALAASGPMFPTTMRGLADLSKHLRGGGFTALLLDQYAEDGMPLPFLGHDAMTGLSMARLAVKTKALIIPLSCVRQADGKTIKVVVSTPLTSTDPVQIARELNDFMSAEILKHPEQWYWLHRRWKNVRPQGADKA